MPVTLRFEAGFDRESLMQLRDEIDRLMSTLPPEPTSRREQPEAQSTSPAKPPNAQDLAWRKVGALWERLGINTRTFLSTCVSWPAGAEFTFEDVAERLGADVKTVRSWHRNLSRSLRGVERQYGPEPPLFHQRWVEDRNRYSLSPEVHLAIKEQYPMKPAGPDDIVDAPKTRDPRDQ